MIEKYNKFWITSPDPVNHAVDGIFELRDDAPFPKTAFGKRIVIIDIDEQALSFEEREIVTVFEYAEAILKWAAKDRPNEELLRLKARVEG